MDQICLRCFVSGHVQGVFYRAFVEDEAISREITGWVRNLSDGRVEALLCGEREAVENLRDRLWTGPPRADVTRVESEEIPWENHQGFTIR